MRLALVALVLVLLVPLGCSNKGQDSAGVGRAAEGVDSSPGEPPGLSIYAAVIRQLVTQDHTFGGADPGFRVVYLLDGSVAGAGDVDPPNVVAEPDRPFGTALTTGLANALADLPPLRFVANRASAIVATGSGTRPGHVRHRGALITLGPIRRGGERVEVGANIWISGLAGMWQTYVLRATNGEWSVVGTTGPVAIS